MYYSTLFLRLIFQESANAADAAVAAMLPLLHFKYVTIKYYDDDDYNLLMIGRRSK
jgi:hypothetical protein